jgi:hypothetical protein
MQRTFLYIKEPETLAEDSALLGTFSRPPFLRSSFEDPGYL